MEGKVKLLSFGAVVYSRGMLVELIVSCCTRSTSKIISPPRRAIVGGTERWKHDWRKSVGKKDLQVTCITEKPYLCSEQKKWLYRVTECQLLDFVLYVRARACDEGKMTDESSDVHIVTDKPQHEGQVHWRSPQVRPLNFDPWLDPGFQKPVSKKAQETKEATKETSQDSLNHASSGESVDRPFGKNCKRETQTEWKIADALYRLEVASG